MLEKLKKLLNSEIEFYFDSRQDGYEHKGTIIGFSLDFKYVFFADSQGYQINTIKEPVLYNAEDAETLVKRSYIGSLLVYGGPYEEFKQVQRMVIDSSNKRLREEKERLHEQIKNKNDMVEYYKNKIKFLEL